MFRTDLNHFLQSFDANFIYKFMEAVSFMGTIYMLLLTILVLIGGVNFRKGFLVLNILGWGVLIMFGAKSYFDYPRPLAVDATLVSFGSDQTAENLTHLQPNDFFEGFSDELLLKIRDSDVARNGLPSGHVMIITGVWLSIAFLFRKKCPPAERAGLYVASTSLVVLTIISRMYLGMHYLGDVTLGLLMGLGLIVGFNMLFKKLGLDEALYFDKKSIMFFGAPLVLIVLYKIVPSFQVGALIGLNLALLLILKKWGEPIFTTSKYKRIANTLIFIVLYFAMFFLTKKLHLDKSGMVSVLVNTALNFTVLLASFYAGKLVGVYTFRNSIE